MGRHNMLEGYRFIYNMFMLINNSTFIKIMEPHILIFILKEYFYIIYINCFYIMK